METQQPESTLRVRMPPAMLSRLDARAAEEHRTRSQQVRYWIEGWLDRLDELDRLEAAEAPKPAPPAPPRKRSKRR